jgi:hypothetical protein
MSELYGPVVYTKLGSLCSYSKSVAGLELFFLGSDKNKTALEEFAVMGLQASLHVQLPSSFTIASSSR